MLPALPVDVNLFGHLKHSLPEKQFFREGSP
jgi:hypothetical protein